MNPAANDNRVIVSVNDVLEMTSLSRGAITKFRAAGGFPREIQLGERRIGFLRTEVLDWIEERVNARAAA